jgi:hypothetical protein
MHVFIQILIMSGIFISYLNRHCESETVELRFRKRNNSDRLFSTKKFEINIHFVLISRSLSLHPPLPSILSSLNLSINATLSAYRILSHVEDNGIKRKKYDLSSEINFRLLKNKAVRRGRELQS